MTKYNFMVGFKTAFTIFGVASFLVCSGVKIVLLIISGGRILVPIFYNFGTRIAFHYVQNGCYISLRYFLSSSNMDHFGYKFLFIIYITLILIKPIILSSQPIR